MVQENPLLLVECWARTEPDAFGLATLAWRPFHDLRYGAMVGDCWVAESWPASPLSHEDANTGLPRYQFTVNLVVNLKETS